VASRLRGVLVWERLLIWPLFVPAEARTDPSRDRRVQAIAVERAGRASTGSGPGEKARIDCSAMPRPGEPSGKGPRSPAVTIAAALASTKAVLPRATDAAPVGARARPVPRPSHMGESASRATGRTLPPPQFPQRPLRAM
jgi:hypothetical protein